MTTIHIPIRELHARTGHFVRKASSDLRVIITDRGKPIAQLQPLGQTDSGKAPRPKWKNRVLCPEYARMMKILIAGTDSTQAVSDDRSRGGDW